MIVKGLFAVAALYLVIGLPIAVQILITVLEIPEIVMEHCFREMPEAKGIISFKFIATLIFFTAWFVWPYAIFGDANA